MFENTEQLASPESGLPESQAPEVDNLLNAPDDEGGASPVLEVEAPEEYEHDGKKYQVDKALAAHLKELRDGSLRQADYTQKTQTVAQERQQLEAQRAEFAQRQQFQQQHIQSVAKVMALDSQLEQFSKLDWNALTDADPVQALKLDRQMRELQQQRQQNVSAIEQAQARVSMEQSQATARQLQAAQAELSKEIKGYGTPELTKALTETGKAFGYKAEELASVQDPRAVRLLHEAYLYRQLVSKAQAKEPTNVTPITRVTGATASGTKSIGDAGLSDAEFIKMRRDYIRKHR